MDALAFSRDFERNVDADNKTKLVLMSVLGDNKYIQSNPWGTRRNLYILPKDVEKGGEKNWQLRLLF